LENPASGKSLPHLHETTNLIMPCCRVKEVRGLPDAAPKVEVLRCDACGASVPLAAGDRITCVHCGQAATPSAAHLALRDAVSGDADTRRRGEALARELLAAGPFLRALSRFVSDGGYLLPAFIAMGVGAFVSMMALFNLQSFGLRFLHVDVIDVLRDGEFMALFVAIIAIFVGGVPVVAALGLRTAQSRAVLLRSLAARLSARQGENPECRQCGAPLVIAAADAVVAVCHYCSADNLVVVPDEVLAMRISATANLNAGIQAAAQEYRRENALVRRSFLIRSGWVVLPIVLTYVLFSLGEKAGRPAWRDAVAAERLWLPQYTAGTTAKDAIVAFPCRSRDAFSVLMALRYGESLRAVVSSPTSVPSVLLAAAQGKRPLIDGRGGPASVDVPHSGWFEIIVQPKPCPLEHLADQITIHLNVR
jgi:hypothetical protein